MLPPIDPDYRLRFRDLGPLAPGGHPGDLSPHGGPMGADVLGREQRAAVAAVLCERERELELLLMVRAERPGDRWSGQVCLPGGRMEAVDGTSLDAARRETLEELGIDPAQFGPLLGRLTPIQARARGGRIPLWIEPYVWLAHERPAPRLGPEAAASFWLPLSACARGERSIVFPYAEALRVHHLPALADAGRTIWGLTYAIVVELLDTVAPGAPPLSRLSRS